MTEQLITFDTAVFAEVQGFRHMKANCFGDNMAYTAEGKLKPAHNANVIEGYVLAPTQSLLQKWLREKHKIDITLMIRNDNDYEVIIHHKRGRPMLNKTISLTSDNYKTGVYEEALELGLQEALKLIQ